jgi:DNA-binding transcriptional LysR family regulator
VHPQPAQALLTRPGLTDLDRCPVQNLGTASRPNLNRKSHQDSTNKETPRSLTENRQFYKFIILTMILLFAHDSAIRWEESEVLQEPLLLDDLRALVEFAQAGSIAGAAHRLYRTPSAITRQLQRLEAQLGAELLDRSVKPPRLSSLGSRVLEQARDLLQRAEAMKSAASRDAEPHGLLRIGLAHPLAEGTLIEPIRALTETYPKVRLLLLSERTPELFNRLIAGDLDVAVVPLPEGKTAPPPLLTNIIATDRVEIVQVAAGNVAGDWKSLSRASWVLNPPGCFLRADLIEQMGRVGFTPMIAAEIHNMHLQLAFVQSGYGVGLLPARFIASNNSLHTVEVLRPPSFDLHMSVAMVRVGQLGALEKAVGLLERGIRLLFEAANAKKPVSRSRRRVPVNRRNARLRK